MLAVFIVLSSRCIRRRRQSGTRKLYEVMCDNQVQIEVLISNFSSFRGWILSFTIGELLLNVKTPFYWLPANKYQRGYFSQLSRTIHTHLNSITFHPTLLPS